MRNQPETLHEYNIPRLNWWFLISSALFVGCLVLMIWADYSGGKIEWLGLHGDRQWKNYQQEFYTLEKQRLTGDMKAAEARANEAGLAKLQEDPTKSLSAKNWRQGCRAKLQAEGRPPAHNSLITRSSPWRRPCATRCSRSMEGA